MLGRGVWHCASYCRYFQSAVSPGWGHLTDPDCLPVQDIDNEPIEQALLKQLDDETIPMISEFFTGDCSLWVLMLVHCLF